MAVTTLSTDRSLLGPKEVPVALGIARRCWYEKGDTAVNAGRNARDSRNAQDYGVRDYGARTGSGRCRGPDPPTEVLQE
ncbi:hypothetical protein GCM10011505_27860 [Tistrella bauzanensis]|uniref:Uncharacterized protein n=1 Tax=Tistrella bauzanensis TaxID=657419 RepID=A0ABQ1IK07_9PROT|nr:hypothetical protein GCM10011505_27860 [Tistrella bauzanensis]